MKRKKPLKRSGWAKRAYPWRKKPKEAPPDAAVWPRTRRKPLRGSGKRIRPIAPQKRKKHAYYVKAVKEAARWGCVRCGCRTGLDPHHPRGRGKYLMEFVMVCQELHQWIHFGDPKEAYRQGWLQPEYRGMAPDKKHPRPWEKGPVSLPCVLGNY